MSAAEDSSHLAEDSSHLAAQCRGWADKAETERVRKVFLELAQFWEAAALRAKNLSSGTRNVSLPRA